MSYAFHLFMTAALTCLVLLATASWGYKEATSAFEKGAIERGYAQYCPADGAWAWKGECGK